MINSPLLLIYGNGGHNVDMILIDNDMILINPSVLFVFICDK